ncbi:precorrin-3B C(17)-methyltransferase [Microcoleus sp. FACHB-1515]|uniref:precorrin-3B C(17)-methyltransferase n=1 Tax=Cyanophyceae TaxID=3028117 RepID=UPI0016821D10|nr:precorrin-3B C(17)-methyltransferase [Microcoleus sp. FACHB-1515]MBD2088464.1 precorrin-3B C(17)-methyltransferase [Microcoleus sp. FACHB-1515]
MSVFTAFEPLAAIAVTPTGIAALRPFCLAAGIKLWVPESIVQPDCQSFSGSLRSLLPDLWQTHRGIVFCLATGAVVRLIAPLLKDKGTDPAIVVVDENRQFAISLCSGHQGGAENLTRLVAEQSGATPILTGASTRAELPGIDVLGVSFGWRKGEGDWTGVSAATARGETIQVIQEAGSTLWQEHLPAQHPFNFDVDYSERPAARIWISPIQRRFSPESDFPKVQWHPRVLWIGIGCERGTSSRLIASAIDRTCRAHHLSESAIAGIASIDLKADEVGLLEFCRDRNLPLRCFSSEHLRSIEVPNPSAIVAAEVGTPSVAEAAAILAARPDTQHPTPDTLLRVKKQIVREEGEAGAVTIAIAQSQQELIDRTGQLWLIGTGPGAIEQITPAARSAIAQADVVIGYSLYVDLVSPLLRPGQIVETSPITQERQRGDRAIDLAQWGLTVAVISSGDCGIYGMAGLVMEQLQQRGWDGKSPKVQVFPGITALQAAAARVGAPLMHDFCAISLSDLLTPWSVIEKRLTAAAAADFVTAIYNPRSQTRTQQIATAREIFLQHRKSDTPVALVRSVYRPDEQIMLTTLGELDVEAIDMLTVVLIGNQSTRQHGDWLITPRGYLGFGEESSPA